MIHEAYMPVYMGSRFLARTDGRDQSKVVQEGLADLKRGGDSLCVIMLLKPYIFSVCHVNRITCNSLLSTFLISADSPESCTTDSFSLC